MERAGIKISLIRYVIDNLIHTGDIVLLIEKILNDDLNYFKEILNVESLKEEGTYKVSEFIINHWPSQAIQTEVAV